MIDIYYYTVGFACGMLIALPLMNWYLKRVNKKFLDKYRKPYGN